MTSAENEEGLKEDHKLNVHQQRTFAGGMLSITTTYRLLITGDCGLKELERLIRILTVQKQILEESDVATTGNAIEELEAICLCQRSTIDRLERALKPFSDCKKGLILNPSAQDWTAAADALSMVDAHQN